MENIKNFLDHYVDFSTLSSGIFWVFLSIFCRSETRPPEDDEEEEEEILGSDDDEQEDPKDYVKGKQTHSVENIVAGVTFQFWAIFINFG